MKWENNDLSAVTTENFGIPSDLAGSFTTELTSASSSTNEICSVGSDGFGYMNGEKATCRCELCFYDCNVCAKPLFKYTDDNNISHC